MGGCNLPKDNPGLSQGRALPSHGGASWQPPLLPLPVTFATSSSSPSQLCQHTVKPAGKGERGESRREKAPILHRGCRSRWAGEAAAAAAAAGSNTPGWSWVSRPLCIPCGASWITPCPPGSADTRAFATRGSGILPDKETGTLSRMGSPARGCCQCLGWSGGSRASLEQGTVTGRDRNP